MRIPSSTVMQAGGQAFAHDGARSIGELKSRRRGEDNIRENRNAPPVTIVGVHAAVPELAPSPVPRLPAPYGDPSWQWTAELRSPKKTSSKNMSARKKASG